MTAVEILNEKIQELEAMYAELLGSGASQKELNEIWNEIKALKKRLSFIELTQTNDNTFSKN